MLLRVNRQFFFSVVVDPLFSQHRQRCLHTLATDSDVVPFQVARAYSFVVSTLPDVGGVLSSRELPFSFLSLLNEILAMERKLPLGLMEEGDLGGGGGRVPQRL